MTIRPFILALAFLALGAGVAKAGEARGFVDTVFANGSKISASGWVRGASPDDKLVALDIYTGDDACLNQRFTAAPRPDVVTATGRNDWLDSGWELDAQLAARLKPGMYPVRVVAHFADSGAIDLMPSRPGAKEIVIEKQKLSLPRLLFWSLMTAVIACLICENVKPHAPAAKYAAWVLVAVVFYSLALRQFIFVDKYAVNMMYWDQWDFYTPIFSGGNWWRVFDYQHGPHRQGAGFLITEALAKLSGWNSRWDAFGVSFLITGASALGLLVAWRCGVRAGAAWVAVPLLFFNIRQYEGFVGASNLSHGAMPILLMMCYSLAWFIPSRAWRLGILSLLTFLLIFTGFGLFMGLVTPLLFTVEILQAIKARENTHVLAASAALGAVLISWLLFAHGYAFVPVAPGFKFPWDRPVEYLYFMALMLTNFHGMPEHGAAQIAAGLCMVLGLAAICFWHAKVILSAGMENGRRSAVIFSLAAFALLYAAYTAVGRVCFGLDGAPAASRYVTLMIPAGFAFFLQLASVRSARTAGLLGVAYALLLAAGTLDLRRDDWDNVNWFHNGRLAWKEAYLKTGDEMEANRLAGFRVYPDPGVITERLDYLRRHKLNLFSDTSK